MPRIMRPLRGRDPSPPRMVFTALGKPRKDRLADQEMTDIELHDLGQRGDRLGGLEIEPMAGMNLEPETPRELRAVADALPFGLRRRGPIVGQGIAPGAGMNLDHGRADRRPPPRSAAARRR